MEPVFSLIEGNALGSFQHFVGYLLTAMGWETVHEDGISFRLLHHLCVDHPSDVIALACIVLGFIAVIGSRPFARWATEKDAEDPRP